MSRAAIRTRRRKNELCAPIPHPNSDIDWLRITRTNAINSARWNSDPDLGAWLRGSRLDAYSQVAVGVEMTEAVQAVFRKIGEHTPNAITNLERLLEGIEG
ncbi:MAG: hypothetical protein WD939_07725 [Dehalococcoidia bacterium]